MRYAERTKRPRPTLTDAEVKQILKVTGHDRAGFRDHLIISLALGCALRESEIVGLNIDDVTRDRRRPVRLIQLRVFKRAGADADPEAHRVHVPDATWYKLEKYLKTKIHPGFTVAALPTGAPLFRSQRGTRLSTRQVRNMWRAWQKRAGFDHLYPFHTLRHTAITLYRRRVKDLSKLRRFARHASIATTMIYDHPSDQELADAVKDQAA